MFKIDLIWPLLLFGISVACSFNINGTENHIIGGNEVDIARHPYLVSIRYKIQEKEAYFHECAGVIYRERVIITGAQCIQGLVETDKVLIIAGARTRTGADGMPYPVTKWIAHPNYDYYTVDFDIGIFILDISFDFGHYHMHPIQIRETRPLANRNALVAGWGYREEWGPSSNVLEEVQVPIVSDDDCLKIYGVREITERMICAGDLVNGGRDACQGDTGGPLLVDGQLVGIVSWGYGCARKGYPSVYTYVPALKNWLDETIAENVN